MYLLDAPVVWELGKAREGRTDEGLANWAGNVAAESLFLSALGLLELETGAARLVRKDKARGSAAKAWIEEQVVKAFAGRILPVDAAVVRRRAVLPYADNRDALLAATALEHGLTLVTRNVAAFRTGRVKLFNPWGYTADVDEDADWRQAGRTGSLWLKNLFVRT